MTPRELRFARCRHFRGPTMPWSCAHGHQLQVDHNTTRLRGCLCYETDKTHECPDFDSGTGQMRLFGVEYSELGTIEPTCEHGDCDEAGTIPTRDGLRCPQHRAGPEPGCPT